MKEKTQTKLLVFYIVTILICGPIAIFSLGKGPLVDKDYYIIKSVRKEKPDKYEYSFENSGITIKLKEKYQVGDTLIITKK